MKEYNILKTVLLGFLTHNDSYDMLLEPGTGHLKFNGQDIIFVDVNGVEHVSITDNSAIEIWLKQNWVELKNEQPN
jgi:hypothetical protein